MWGVAKHIILDLSHRNLHLLMAVSAVLLFLSFQVGLSTLSPQIIDVGDQTDERYVRGFHQRESNEWSSFRWTKADSYVVLADVGHIPMTFSLAINGWRPQDQPAPQVVLLANGREMANFVAGGELRTYQFRHVPPVLPPSRNVVLEIRSEVFAPTTDQAGRTLGVLVDSVVATPIAEPLWSFYLVLVLLLSLAIGMGYLALRSLGGGSWFSFLGGLLLLILACSVLAICPLRTVAFSMWFLAFCAVCYVSGLIVHLRGHGDVLGRLGTRVLTGLRSPGRMLGEARRAGVASVRPECWLLVALCFAARLANLTVLPVFNDEAIYIQDAQRADPLQDPFFPLYTISPRPVLEWVGFVFVRLLPDPLLSARLASVCAGTGAMMGLYLAATMLYSRRTAALASAFYCVSPLMLWHDRMFLADVLLNSCAVWTLVFSLLMAKRAGLRYAFALGLVVGLGILSKISGLLILAVPLAVSILLPGTRMRPLLARLSVAYATVGLVISPVMLHPLRSRAFVEIGTRGAMAAELGSAVDWARSWAANLRAVGGGLGAYLTTPIILTCVLSLLLVLVLRDRRGVLLWGLVLLPVLALVASPPGFLPPRYFLFAVSPLMICSAWCVDQISDRISRGVRWLVQRSPALSRLNVSLCSSIVFTSLAIGVCVAPLRLDYYILTDPSRVPLPAIDEDQYITGWPSGYGILEAAGWLEKQASHTELLVIVHPRRGIPADGLLMYLHGDDRIAVLKQNLREPVEQEELVDHTFFVADPPADSEFAELNPGAQLVARFDKPMGMSAIEIYTFPGHQR